MPPAKIKTKGRRRSYKGPGCPRCKRPLGSGRLVTGLLTCPHCQSAFEAVRFTPPEPRAVVRQVAEAGPGESVSCANHAKNEAVANCERCGGFICELCKIEADGKTLCPACFDRLSAEGALESTVTTFKDYGRMASSLAVVGLLMWIFAPVFGLAAAYYATRGLRQKRKMGESDGVVSMYIALVLGILETVGGTLLLLAMFGVFR